MSQEPLLRALVLEDEWPARNYLVELIETSQLAQVVGAVESIDEAREALSGLPVDVVFVDIQLEGTGGTRTGLDLIRSMAASPGAPMFVLATAFSQHALEAFNLGVVDYLLKPFSEERVTQCLRRLIERRPAPRPGAMRVVARRKKSLVFLDPDELWAFEAADRLTYVHSRHGRFDIDLSLTAIEASFGRTLTRVHRNWLVNLAYVKELGREDGETTVFVGTGMGDTNQGILVPVSRDRAQSLRESLLTNATGVRRG
ncbi:LytTR family DNA-binding domain-containing protein [Vitiosangium sp. GDMCC 1.1324]|uniref:LytR/AlgR family response regulator transcription factor n=1 Tax=Vitiosangium sp. (strain GDMCC 1.1324) TaxID=2138576 RepID=UPI00130E6B1F|nr:LytTR family DNA-binding domain-containing protein [Vitiosangium sp. GDMCC 1.1324]